MPSFLWQKNAFKKVLLQTVVLKINKYIKISTIQLLTLFVHTYSHTHPPVKQSLDDDNITAQIYNLYEIVAMLKVSFNSGIHKINKTTLRFSLWLHTHIQAYGYSSFFVCMYFCIYI